MLRHRQPGQCKDSTGRRNTSSQDFQTALPCTFILQTARRGTFVGGSQLLTSRSWQPRFTTARYNRVPKPWSYNHNPQNVNQNLSRPKATVRSIQNMDKFFFSTAIRSLTIRAPTYTNNLRKISSTVNSAL
jgi:hypothetical protein